MDEHRFWWRASTLPGAEAWCKRYHTARYQICGMHVKHTVCHYICWSPLFHLFCLVEIDVCMSSYILPIKQHASESILCVFIGILVRISCSYYFPSVFNFISMYLGYVAVLLAAECRCRRPSPASLVIWHDTTAWCIVCVWCSSTAVWMCVSSRCCSYTQIYSGSEWKLINALCIHADMLLILCEISSK